MIELNEYKNNYLITIIDQKTNLIVYQDLKIKGRLFLA